MLLIRSDSWHWNERLVDGAAFAADGHVRTHKCVELVQEVLHSGGWQAHCRQQRQQKSPPFDSSPDVVPPAAFHRQRSSDLRPGRHKRVVVILHRLPLQLLPKCWLQVRNHVLAKIFGASPNSNGLEIHGHEFAAAKHQIRGVEVAVDQGPASAVGRFGDVLAVRFPPELCACCIEHRSDGGGPLDVFIPFLRLGPRFLPPRLRRLEVRPILPPPPVRPAHPLPVPHLACAPESRVEARGEAKRQPQNILDGGWSGGGEGREILAPVKRAMGPKVIPALDGL
mmetsp:Transcript_23005/g.48735  ORF Transcript_23005/g.48735 Transcript_23005/m.48735 type:complete len:282 (-) Transcript_23005:564-1409(-)